MGVDAYMTARTMAPVTDEDIKRWSFEVASRFGHHNFAVYRPGRFSWYPNGQRALGIRVITEDSGEDDVRPAEGETIIDVHLNTRYWGPGYERGNLPLILTVAEWLERRIPGAAVWYGGDSDGELFDARAREALLRHCVSARGADYFCAPNPFREGNAPRCDFCGPQMRDCRGGFGGTGYACQGCGLRVLIAENGARTQNDAGWPDEVCAECNRARDNWTTSGCVIDGAYRHLDCWARKLLEQRGKP